MGQRHRVRPGQAVVSLAWPFLNLRGACVVIKLKLQRFRAFGWLAAVLLSAVVRRRSSSWERAAGGPRERS